MSGRVPIESFLVAMRDQPWKQAITIPHLESHGFNPRIIWGLSGYQLALRASNPFGFDNKGEPEFIHPSQVGCCLSHIGALQAAVAIGAEEFIVFEDDVVLVDDWSEKWNALRESVDESVDVIQLEHLHATNHDKIAINGQIERCFYPFGAAAIWWRKRAAESAINLLHPIDMPYDIMLIRRVYPFMNHAIAKVPLVSQRSACGEWPSSIGDSMKTGTNRFE